MVASAHVHLWLWDGDTVQVVCAMAGLHACCDPITHFTNQVLEAVQRIMLVLCRLRAQYRWPGGVMLT